MSQRAFDQLRREWYAKAQADGAFEDIERFRGDDEGWLKSHRNLDPDVDYSCTEEYFTRARSYAFEGKFASERERDIWAMHAEGVPHDDIARKTRSSVCQTVQRTINTHRRIMLSADTRGTGGTVGYGNEVTTLRGAESRHGIKIAALAIWQQMSESQTYRNKVLQILENSLNER